MTTLNWKIKEPYILDKKDIDQINKYPDLPWEDKKYNMIKARIKLKYCLNQKGYCAYCRTELEYKCHSSHIDHIVDKASRPGWRFTGLNLTLTCSQCNTTKSDKETLNYVSRNATSIPTEGAFYKIIHPHFDIYSKHIDYEDGIFVKALDNDKGANTIEICQLSRSLYVERRGKHAGLSKMDRRIKVLDKLNTSITPDEKKELQEYVDELLKYLD